MQRFAVSLCLVLAMSASGARADEAPPQPGCAVGSTNILPMQQQDQSNARGDVTINCSLLTEAFGNQLTDILNRILHDRLDPQMVLVKLDEVDRVPEEGVARAIDESQRHLIIESLNGKRPAEIAITAHPVVDDSAEFAKQIATPLLMVGWRIEGNEIRRVAIKSLEPVTGVALVVRDKAAAPQKALELKAALNAAHVSARLVSDAVMAPDATLLWIGRRPVFMAPEAPPK
jgi:hypothetical protein